ncbi:MAG TPA: hypothetical protein PKY81_10470 [bacterium]|nr:hypothetical protein [bacterium]
MFFGYFVKQLRIKQKIGLREFTQLINYDPSNWSKIERGVLKTPQNKNLLNRIIEVLKIKKSSKEYETFYNLSTNGEKNLIPVDIPDMFEDKSIIPALLRTVGGYKKLKKKEAIKLLQILQKEKYGDLLKKNK